VYSYTALSCAFALKAILIRYFSSFLKSFDEDKVFEIKLFRLGIDWEVSKLEFVTVAIVAVL